MQSTFPNPIEMLAPFQDYYRKPKQASGGIEKRVESIILLVKQAIQNELPLKAYFSQYLITILQFRFELFQQLPELIENIDNIYQDITQILEDEHKDSRFHILSENVGFAIRTNQRVIQPLLDSDFAKKLDITSPLFEEWVLSSVLIEFGLIAEIVLKHEEILISDKRIQDFAAFVADAAQDFGALSRMLGILPQKKNKLSQLMPLNEDITAEQYTLAEDGAGL